MTREEQRLAFVNALFDEGDMVATGQDPKTCNKPVELLPYFIRTEDLQFCINPLQEWRKTENITKIVNLLFEVDSDLDGNPVPLEEQKKLFYDSGLPFTTMVESGKKSVHVIIRLEVPLKSKELQTQVWWAVARALKKHGILADERARLIVQISRLPGSLRPVTLDTGEVIYNEQRLVTIRDRVSHSELLQWITANGEKVQKPVKPKPNTYVTHANDHVTDLHKFETALRWNENKWGRYISSAQSGNHNFLFDLGVNFWKVDLSIDVGTSIANMQLGTTHNTQNGVKQNEEVLIKGYKFGQTHNMKQYTFKR